jgi:esterase/lipase superfamily enzyme
MATKRRPLFDPQAFLAKIGDGHVVDKYRKDQVIFSQGDAQMLSSTSGRAK